MSGGSATTNTTSGNTKKHPILFHGKSGEFFGIWIVNILLSIITLGIYSAWATVRTRRYFYGNTEINGDRFDYHATGLQILIGRIVMAVLLILYVVLSRFSPIFAFLILLAILLLAPYFIMRSWRYNAIMSSFRGIRFNYESKIGRGYWVIFILPFLLFIGLYLITGLLLNFTVIKPIMSNSFTTINTVLGVVITMLFIAGLIVINGITNCAVNDLYVNQHAFGKSKFKANLDKKVFMRISAIACLIFIPFLVLMILINFSTIMMLFQSAASGNPNFDPTSILGTILMIYLLLIIGAVISLSYSYVAKRNYIFSQTVIAGEVKINSTMTVGSYIALSIKNTLIVIFTLGLGMPIAAVRHARYVAANTQVEGDLSLLNVTAHGDKANSSISEEIVQGFDLNIM